MEIQAAHMLNKASVRGVTPGQTKPAAGGFLELLSGDRREANLILTKRLTCGTVKITGRLFCKSRIDNYFRTDGSRCAREFDYRLNGILDERVLIC